MQDTVFVVHCERIPRKQAYKVWFPYNEQLIEMIRKLPKDSRKWHSFEKIWELKTSALYTLIKGFRGSKKIYFDFGNPDSRKIFAKQIKKIEKKEKERKKLIADLEKKKEYWVTWKKELEKNYLKYWDRVHENLKEDVKLYPHQVVATMFLDETRNALISHEMGLGKSIISISYVEMNNFEKVLVITPNSLKFNYYNEVEKFTNSKVHVINWKKNPYSIEEAKYVIVNYEYFNPSSKEKVDKKWKKLKIDKGELDCVICDESHRLKSTKSNTYKNFKRIFGKDELFRNKNVSKVFMTGTPAPNRVYELYSVLNQISPLDFATKKYFYEYYCGMTYDLNGFGWVSNGSQAKLEELYHKIAPYTHRKRKKDVSTDLPDKTYQRIVLEMSDKDYKTYNDIEEGVANDFINQPTIHPLSIMIRLRQFTSHLKINELKEIINTIVETGEKIIIVDEFKEPLYELYEKFKDISGLHTGDQTPEERNEVVKRFQDPDDSMLIFFGTIPTVNYGLTLTAASKMFIMSLPYSVGKYDQVSDRCHRISQKNAVNIYPLIFPDTIDDYVYSSIEDKRTEIVKVMDNEDYKSDVQDSVVNDVIKKIKSKHGK